ncbi:MAG: hypothetical protein APF80_03440 [Alphaproteobacteria bacterium BRH_c36]|nr:MAG: hypothetical protein APF80_03440 [Alphaproteobacteria bacterium BRH_c36]
MMTFRTVAGSVCVALAVLLAAPVGAQSPAGSKAAPGMMDVNWNDPAIKSFVRDRQTNPPQSVGPEDEAKLSRLKLPVIAFDRPPGVVSRAFGAEALPARQRQVVMDPDNPVWYTIVDTYGDLTVVIDADLRIQQQLPAGTQVFTPPQGIAAEPHVSTVDRGVEEGMEGLIAEYTVLKFPDIPYRVTVECSPARKQHCTDEDAILRDRESLTIISARPPE